MTYTHHIPGRLRIRSAAAKRHPGEAARMGSWLESIPGVTCVAVSAVTGSALVHYNPEIADGTGIVMLLEEEGWIDTPAAGPHKTYEFERAIARKIIRYVAEAAIERSVIAIAAAIL